MVKQYEGTYWLVFPTLACTPQLLYGMLEKNRHVANQGNNYILHLFYWKWQHILCEYSWGSQEHTGKWKGQLLKCRLKVLQCILLAFLNAAIPHSLVTCPSTVEHTHRRNIWVNTAVDKLNFKVNFVVVEFKFCVIIRSTPSPWAMLQCVMTYSEESPKRDSKWKRDINTVPLILHHHYQKT